MSLPVTITRRLEFDAGHRLMGHESKCRNVHGHRYVVEVEVAAEALDAVGRVIDFSVIKADVGGWIDERLDHGFLFQDGDPIELFLIEHQQRRYAMKAPPTAENIATLLLGTARELMRPHGIEVVSMTVWETPNCRAVAR